jgi:allantoinase
MIFYLGSEMKVDLFLREAWIVSENGVFKGGIAIKEGKISHIVASEDSIEAEEILDLEGKFLLPGIVDAHVHFNQPGREDWEGFLTGTMAAAAGGVTTVIDMPLNSTPPTISRRFLTGKLTEIQGKAFVDYALWGGLVNNNLEELDGLSEGGVIGFKAFLCPSGIDEFSHLSDDLLYLGLSKAKDLGTVIGLHAENGSVTSLLEKKIRSIGRVDRLAWCESRPVETEDEAISRACFWAQITGGHLHIVHVSSPSGIRIAVQSKEKGANVTVETCPHYLFFDQRDFERIGPALKCAPPIRERALVEDLWKCVKRGEIDTIGSDHSPCTWNHKEKGIDNIWEAWGGISGIQSMLPALLTEGFHKRRVPLTTLTRLLSSNPARIFGLYPRKGSLVPGADADLVVVNLDKEWVLTSEQLFYKNKFSPFVGYKFKGAVERTFVRGITVYNNGEIIVSPDFGQFLRRFQPHRASEINDVGGQ